MTTLARFVRGANKIYLDETTYYLGNDFTPPSPAREFNFASGTSLNRTGGASLVGSRALNRDVDFTVNVKGTTEAACIASARRLASFVMSGDGLYFEIQLYPGLPEPAWGQFGSWLRYEVVTAIAKVNERYGNFGASASVHAQVVISLQVKPYATGNKQRLINAAGYVFENNYGSVTGEALGLSVHDATTNKMTNPVLGHATFGNGWTAGSGLIVTKNTDTTLTLPGILQSAKVISLATTNNTYTQSIAAGNTNKHSFSAYVYLPDGGAPTTADFDIYYGAAKSTTYQSLGNGLYLAYSDNIDGISAATATGIVVKSGRTVYLCGFQMEEKAYHTPLAYGDLLGCAWTGTVHASTSTRTATNINVTRADDFIRLEEGAVSLVWKPYNSNTFGADETLFGLYKSDYAASGLLAYFESTDDKFYFTDGTNTISTAAQTFAVATPLYLTFTWGPGGLNIYKSGSNAATGATYTPASTTNQAVFVIGQANAATIANGDILGFDVYDLEISSTQAAALYTAQAALVAGGKRVSSVPWLWTKDGDAVLDNYSDATHSCIAVASGVPGNVACKTDIKITPSHLLTDIWMGSSAIQYGDYASELLQYFVDLSGTVVADSIGGQALDDAVQPSATLVQKPGAFFGKNIHFFSRIIKKSSGSSYAAGAIGYSSTQLTQNTRSVSFTAPAALSLYYLGSISASDFELSQDDSIQVIHTIGSGGADLYLDAYMAFPGNILRIKPMASSAAASIHISDDASAYAVMSTNKFEEYMKTYGEILEISPGGYNLLFSIIGDHGGDWTLSYTNTIAYIEVTPRWSLL